MVHLLVIADDFTGALDCGVQLTERGCKTRVVVGVPESLGSSEVLVVDSETRHLAPEDAHGVILGLARLARAENVGCIYKKTDSALRGNIGAELAALLEGFGERRLLFFPAYPQMGRTVEGGVLAINGTPVAESVFGADPFEPVRASCVSELIAAQSAAPVTSLPPLRDGAELAGREGILVFDASREEDHEAACRAAAQMGGARLLAGCAGFAGHLTRLLGLGASALGHLPALEPGLLVVCGSVNPITLGQIAYAQRHGFYRVGLTPRQKLERDYWRTGEGAGDLERVRQSLREHSLRIIDVNDAPGGERTDERARERGMTVDDVRVAVAGSVGELVRALIDDPDLGTLFITGGDTLLQCMNTLGVREMEPVCELDTGIVLSRFDHRGQSRYVISKSGGFGGEDLFVTLAKRVSESK